MKAMISEVNNSLEQTISNIKTVSHKHQKGSWL